MKIESMDTEKFLRYSLAFIFILFGGVKLLGGNPLTELIAETALFIPVEIFIPLLAIWEITIGICFLYKSLNRVGLYLFIPHMIGTFLPFIVAPERVFTNSGLTLEGHYILKNLVLIAAAFHIQEKKVLPKSIVDRLEF